MNILSIQSWVAYGHVGNAAAMFPLQRLGAEVWAVNTVQFSNHPGYGGHAGQVLAPDLIAAVVTGIADRGVLGGCDAVLSGYVGDVGTGAAILGAVRRVRHANPPALWCCDPVMGDEGSGLYVRDGIPAFFLNQAVGACDILTPNAFELAVLAERPVTTLRDAKVAAGALQARMRAEGPRIVLVTSLSAEETPEGSLDLLLAADGAFHRLRTPRLAFAGNGAGDAIAALFLFHLLHTGDAVRALEEAGSAIYGLIRRTLEAGQRELAIVAAQEEFVHPSVRFSAQAC